MPAVLTTNSALPSPLLCVLHGLAQLEVGSGLAVVSYLASVHGLPSCPFNPRSGAQAAAADMAAHVASTFRACVTTEAALTSVLAAIELGCTAQFLLEDIDQARKLGCF